MPFTYGLDTLEPAFEDRSVPYIAFGQRFGILTAQHLTQTLGAERAYIIVSSTLSSKTPALKRLTDEISKTQTKLCGTHVGIAPHTPWNQVVEIAVKIREAFGSPPTDRDAIITLGGGSITDGAKVIAWIVSNPEVNNPEHLEQYYSGKRGHTPEGVPGPVVRVITIPTTLSGGEYQAIAGVTRPSGQKCLFTPPTRNPSLVVLDPDLTTTTPAKYWLSTGVRAIDHCVETLCSLQSNPKGDEAAEKGLKAMVSSLLRTRKDSSDLDARFDSMRGVIDAMSAVGSGVPLGGSHAIGHQLGPLGVGHGETSCIMLPAVCKWTASANSGRQSICRDILVQIPEVRQLVTNSGKQLDDLYLGDILDLIIRALGMPRTLTDVGVGRDKLDLLAENTLTDPWAPTNPRPIEKKEQVLEILEMVVGEPGSTYKPVEDSHESHEGHNH